ARIALISPAISEPTMTTVTAARHVTASGLRDPSPKVTKIRATKPTTTIAPICIAVIAASICFRGSEVIMLMAFPLDRVGVDMQLRFTVQRWLKAPIDAQPVRFLAAKHFALSIPRKRPPD